MKRQRGRGRKPGGHQPNRTFESTGPDIKVRGSASHVYEKYLQLARDAQSSGDRVLAESYLQHAEHYFRVLKAMQPQQPVQTQYEQRFDQSYDFEAEGDEGEDVEGDEQPSAYQGPPREPREHRERRFEDRRERREPREPREHREAGDPAMAGEGVGEGEDGQPDLNEGAGEGFGRRGRRRRGRFRPEGEDGGRERRPREASGEREDQPQEGFGDQTPSFLISGE